MQRVIQLCVGLQLKIALLLFNFLCAHVYLFGDCFVLQAPSDPDTLANIITVSYHLQRPQDVINRYLK